MNLITDHHKEEAMPNTRCIWMLVGANLLYCVIWVNTTLCGLVCEALGPYSHTSLGRSHSKMRPTGRKAGDPANLNFRVYVGLVKLGELRFHVIVRNHRAVSFEMHVWETMFQKTALDKLVRYNFFSSLTFFFVT